MWQIDKAFKWTGSALALTVVIICAASAAAAPAAKQPARPDGTTISITDTTKEPKMLYATGEGAMPRAAEQPNRAQAYLQAKAYAKMDAIANLVKAARGTMVRYNSTGKNYVAETIISEEIKGVLDNVQVVSVRKRPEGSDTIVEVVVKSPVPRLPENLAQAPVEQGTQKAQGALEKANPSWVAAAVPIVAGSAPATPPAECHTSVIINAQGFGVVRSMSPKILRQDGSEVWGTVRADMDFLSDYGIAAYTRSLSDALANQRAGTRPLIIRAAGRANGPSKCDVVISDRDADSLLAEDRRSGFLREFRVILVVDPMDEGPRKRK